METNESRQDSDQPEEGTERRDNHAMLERALNGPELIDLRRPSLTFAARHDQDVGNSSSVMEEVTTAFARSVTEWVNVIRAVAYAAGKDERYVQECIKIGLERSVQRHLQEQQTNESVDTSQPKEGSKSNATTHLNQKQDHSNGRTGTKTGQLMDESRHYSPRSSPIRIKQEPNDSHLWPDTEEQLPRSISNPSVRKTLERICSHLRTEREKQENGSRSNSTTSENVDLNGSHLRTETEEQEHESRSNPPTSKNVELNGSHLQPDPEQPIHGSRRNPSISENHEQNGSKFQAEREQQMNGSRSNPLMTLNSEKDGLDTQRNVTSKDPVS